MLKRTYKDNDKIGRVLLRDLFEYLATKRNFKKKAITHHALSQNLDNVSKWAATTV